MSVKSDIIDRIRNFVGTNFPLSRERELRDGDSLLEGGIVDSLGVLDIVTFVESEFAIELSDEDLLADSFETILGISELVEKKQMEVNKI